jgi:peptidoglycan/xylan/chitin deacetylase (PgdA/CDA1 family)
VTPWPGRQGAAAAVLLAAAGASLSCRAVVHRQVRRLARDNPRVLYSVATSAPVVTLTIDDGPDPLTTPPLLDLLERHGARATFFIITSRVAGNEALLRRMVANGHELGNHLFRDEPSVKLPPDEFERQLLSSDALLSRFGPVRWVRPGSGRYNSHMLETIAGHGYQCALGSVYPFDPQIRWSWFSRRFILGTVEPGSVIILHDWGSRGRRTLKTLSTVLPELRARGYSIVPLSELERLDGGSRVK